MRGLTISLVIFGVVLVSSTAIGAGDVGQYKETMDRRGFPGIFLLHSVLAFHTWFFGSLIILIPRAIRTAQMQNRVRLADRFWRLGIFLAIASAGYLLPVAVGFLLQPFGMFGWGTVGILAVFVQLPSMLCLSIGGMIALFLGAFADWTPNPVLPQPLQQASDES